jgi:hypothetical protein
MVELLVEANGGFRKFVKVRRLLELRSIRLYTGLTAENFDKSMLRCIVQGLTFQYIIMGGQCQATTASLL